MIRLRNGYRYRYDNAVCTTEELPVILLDEERLFLANDESTFKFVLRQFTLTCLPIFRPLGLLAVIPLCLHARTRNHRVDASCNVIDIQSIVR